MRGHVVEHWNAKLASEMLSIRAELSTMLFERLKRVDAKLNETIEQRQARLAELEKIRRRTN